MKDLLAAACAAEKAQTLLYRALAAEAEDRGDEALAARLHDLHADEQHHLSRLTARLVELGAPPPDLSHVRPVPVPLKEWEATARQRERDEVRRYESMLEEPLDERTRSLIDAVLEVERRHAETLGGKWTLA